MLTFTLNDGQSFTGTLRGFTTEEGQVCLDIDAGNNTTKVVPVDLVAAVTA